MNRAAFAEFAGRFAESWVAVASLVVTVLFLACALFAPWLSPTNPYDLARLQLIDALKPMGSPQVKPGEEIRANFALTQGQLIPEANATDFEVEACGANCFIVGLADSSAPLMSLQLRGLARDAIVDGASKHPIQPWWTLNAPENNQAKVSFETAPADARVEAIARTDNQPTGFIFQLGSDAFGRDMLSAILYGIRISVFVGVAAAGSAMLFGTGLGLLAAWRGGATDAMIMRAVDFTLSFPAILVGLAILAILGSGVEKVILAVVLVQWCYYARTARSLALSELNKEYIEAARGMRLPAWRIMLRHVLPNCLPQIIVLFTLNIASAISLESSLSFLGVGLPLTQPSLGMLIANGYEYIFSQKYWISFGPGIVLLIMIVAMNLLGDRLRDLNNPRFES
ncbi:ABC transporter permease [Devosia sp. BK]|uniref:ABC transporter permease n=1 Tax=Devosia sp. BK TaxID=2871706 RepID=UPI002939B5E5|nr:ABC transporter permease [Devosia sp. BK]MDV3249737.1 ABC transporter permease [Devosia sp. BK]